MRLGTACVKDVTGQVDRSRASACLEPGQFARWLHAETLAQLRQLVAPTEQFRREARRPRKSRELALALLGEYTHEATRGPEEAMIARETPADLLALACERDRGGTSKAT